MFEVDTTGLVHTAQSLDTYSASLVQMSSRLRKQAGAQVMSNKSYRSVIGLMYSVARDYDTCTKNARAMAGAVRTISTTYASTEREVVTFAQPQLKSGAQPSKSKKTTRTDGEEASSKKSSSDERSIWEDLKNLCKLVEGYLTDSGDDAKNDFGDMAKLFAYIDSFVKFYQKDNWGASGLKGLLDICKDSGGLWKAAYDRMVRYYKVEGLNGLGLFSQNGQLAVAGLGLLNSIVGLVSTFEGLRTGTYDSLLDKVTAYFGKTTQSVASTAKSAYDIKRLYDLIQGGSKVGFKAGGKAGFAYLALVNGGVAIVTSSAKSFDEYVMSDGKCSVNDVCCMGIDIGVSGLYNLFGGGLIDALFGIDGADSIGDGLKSWAESTGNSLAQKSIEGGWDWVFRIGT